MLDTLMKRFAEGAPMALMVGGLLERFLSADELDDWFDRTSEHQYTRELLFYTVFELMSHVVCGMQRSVHAAFQKTLREVGVSVASVYNKLNGIEPAVSAALVCYSREEMAPVLLRLGGARACWLKGYRVKILDGNCLAATEHRLEPLRRQPAAVLPGKTLVVYNPAWEMVIDVVCEGDGHAQERGLVEQLLPGMQPRDAWVADRNFCTRGFLQAIAARGAFFVIRQHGNLGWEPISPLLEVGRTATGTVYEQEVALPAEDGRGLRCRRVVLRLDKPTRDGDWEMAILTSLPHQDASACQGAEIYYGRWRIEEAFRPVTQHLHAEINTLAYPPAALFGFGLALVAFNLLAVVKGALRAVHGTDPIDKELSGYYLAVELASTYQGMMIAIPAEQWRLFREASTEQLAQLLLTLAEHVELRRYRKHPRGPKKPVSKAPRDPAVPHVSTARLLAQHRGHR
ncbi:MAG: transposase [Candidatus Latescibacterota bacterium]